LGTQLDNVADMISKGRDRKATGEQHWSHLYPERVPRGNNHWSHTRPELCNKGETHGMAKLSAAQVIVIRHSFTGARGELTALAHQFGVTPQLIWRIVNNRLWTHLKPLRGSQ
jgi:hypothetical protein